jgi:SAM-dependent methyltransferase
MEDTRETVLKASREYYAHWAYYEDLWAQRSRRLTEVTKRELDFLESAFRVHATHQVKGILDIACGNGRHIIGLAHRGYQCTGQDYTLERVQIAEDIAKREGVSVKLLQGDATSLNYENEFDAVLALNILFLLPSDDDVMKCLRQAYRALKLGGILVCNIGNPFYNGKDWYSLSMIHKRQRASERRVRGMRLTTVDRVQSFDPVHGVAWWQENSVIETPDGIHVFRDRERLRLFTYWDILHYLQEAGFKEIKCYLDWKIKPVKKPKEEKLIFVSRKD